MFKNIGRSIRVLAVVLAALSFLGFAALGTLMLLYALDPAVSNELYVAGLQAAVICYALCVLTPFLNLILYGFGTLISAAQAQARDSQKTREMLQTALSDGMLSEEIARKSAQAQTKLLEYMMTHAPAAEKPAAKKSSRAPMQRPVKEIEDTQEPAKEASVQAPAVPEEAPAPAFIPATPAPQKQAPAAKEAPLKPAPAFIPVTPAPFRAPTAAVPGETTSILTPLSNEDEIF